MSGVGPLVTRPRPRWTRPPRHDGAPGPLVTPVPGHVTLDPSDTDWEQNKTSPSYQFTPSPTTGFLPSNVVEMKLKVGNGGGVADDDNNGQCVTVNNEPIQVYHH